MPESAHARPEPVDLFAELERLEANEPRQRRRWALWLLVLPALTVLVPPLYSHRHPEIGGVPFFVWYQLAAVVAGGAVTGVVYLMRGTERRMSP